MIEGLRRKASVSDEKMDQLRARLAARLSVCWMRLDDAASELSTLHAISDEEIIARVKAIIERERHELPSDADLA